MLLPFGAVLSAALKNVVSPKFGVLGENEKAAVGLPPATTVTVFAVDSLRPNSSIAVSVTTLTPAAG